MSLCDSSDAESGPGDDSCSFQIVITVSVENADALWAAAKRNYLRTAADVEADEVVETIGPLDDPSIEDCLRIVALPAALEGCSIGDIEIRGIPAAVPRQGLDLGGLIELCAISATTSHEPCGRAAL